MNRRATEAGRVFAPHDSTKPCKQRAWDTKNLPAVTALLRSTVALLGSAVATLLGLEARLLVATVSALLVSTLLAESAALLVTALLTACMKRRISSQ